MNSTTWHHPMNFYKVEICSKLNEQQSCCQYSLVTVTRRDVASTEGTSTSTQNKLSSTTQIQGII